MSGSSAPGVSAASGLLGTLGTWLRHWSGETWPSSADLRRQTPGPKAIPYGSIRVLVVDDNPVNLMMMSALLESKGLVPLLAADGAEAVVLACETHFDLILMDLQMPILDGLRATAAIRRFENTGSRPAVPVVAYSLASPGARVLAAYGVDGTLTKPCSAQQLEDCLVRWCTAYRSASTARFVASGNRRRRAGDPEPGSGSVSLR